MRTEWVRALLASTALSIVACSTTAAEPPWDPARVKPCDRACLVAVMDGYLDALLKHDTGALPLEVGARITENAAPIGTGQGVLWRAKVEPSTFKLYVADPVAGQVAVQTVPTIEGIHEVEVFPFVTLPFGSGDGWTPDSGRLFK